MEDLRIAAVICRSKVGQVERNLNDLVRWVQLAKHQGVQLICFPELNLSGYCSARSPKMPVAMTREDPAIARISQIAASERMVILTGMVEADHQANIYVSHMVISPDGVLGVYRKLYLAPPEQGLFTPGDQVMIFTAAGVTFGIQLCYDAHFPELTTRMVELGAEVIFLPHASPRGNAVEKHQSWMRHLPARAYDNGIFVVACNQTGDNCNQLKFPGNAVIIGPSGELIEKAVTGREGLLVADLKADRLRYVRSHPMRHFFSHRRPELFK